MSQAKSYQKGFALLSASGMIIKFVSILYIPIIIAILNGVGVKDEGYGIYTAANMVFTFAYVITNSGTLNAITKMMAEYIATKSERECERAFKIARLALIIIGAFVGFGLFYASDWIANLMAFPNASLSIKALAPSVFLTAVISGYRGYFQGRKDFMARASSQLLEQIVNVGASIGLAAWGMSFTNLSDGQRLIWACAGANGGTTVAAAASMLYLMWYMSKFKKKNNVPKVGLEFRKQSEQNIRAFKVFLAYSVPITLSAGLQNLASLIDAWNCKSRLMVSGLADSIATAQYGQLGKYQQMVQVPVIIVIALASAVLPNLAEARAKNDNKKFKESIEYAYRWCFVVAVPCSIGLGVLAEQVFSVIHLGAGYQLLMYGFVVTVLMGLVQIQSSILQGMTKMYLLAIFLLIGIVAKIAVNYVLIAIPEIRINGAIVGSVICYLIPIALNEWYIRKHLTFKVAVSKYLFKSVFSGAVMGTVVLFLYPLLEWIFALILQKGYLSMCFATIVDVVFGALVYVVIMALIGGLTGRDIDMIPIKVRKFLPIKTVARLMHKR